VKAKSHNDHTAITEESRLPTKAERLVLVVEANPVMQRHVGGLLAGWGYEPILTTTVEESLAVLAHNDFVFTLLDLNLDGADGTEFLRRLKIQGGHPGPIVLLANGHGIQRTIEATALGADDFLKDPFTPEELENVIKSALARPRRRWGRANDDDPRARLQDELGLWRSPQMREVREIIGHAARVDVTVLVSGETGTGKDLVARAIHDLSARRTGPFIKVNCAAMPRELLESELFGHERGAFTGAHQLKIGKFESAHHGTIFLDEIGDLHPALQGKLLHVLQDGQFSRVGGRATIKVNVRVLAATNQNLDHAVADGRFREDLFYRLNVIQILVPPLRQRPEEIPVLAEYFVRRYSALYQHDGFKVPEDTMQRLMRHRFPGNVRELENMIKRMIVLGDPLLTRSAFPDRAGRGMEDAASRPAETARVSLKDIGRKAAQAAEREAIIRTLEETHWNRVKAAKALSISYRAFLYKLKDAGLAPGRPASQ
jgi:two-component system, NtrC family, response regulator AtoC